MSKVTAFFLMLLLCEALAQQNAFSDQVLFRIEKRVYMASEIPARVKALQAFRCMDKSLKVFDSVDFRREDLNKMSKLTPKTYETSPELLRKFMLLSKLQYHYDTSSGVAAPDITSACLKREIAKDKSITDNVKSLVGLEALLRERDRQINEGNNKDAGQSLYIDSLLRRYEHEFFIPSEKSN